ncbi:hypothetical protein DICPUDRAFT_92334 [Dictyostelium purpureum]|uniref:Uncharacterized protein n=1 Tax=Dictyostelium purpureum TaxID=5786 RepID=F0ZQB5_DICPU|nr:uncharacterized protein DICPUDRAFT_92334 [Dictyostelium purpureum]EGC33874.1 hypothetical protein DICPUDRAFT_92334 [Dictyostelium purpureum]|eukprot:XP_003289612.1 hypothetical protein DICPUDRAFT_92334 [Dictyostelium purpureum]
MLRAIKIENTFVFKTNNSFIDIPPCTEFLIFDDEFNKEIPQNSLPEEIKWIIFGNSFNQLLDVNVLPKKLEKIEFGENFNQPIMKNVIPNSNIWMITIGKNFSQTIENIPDLGYFIVDKDNPNMEYFLKNNPQNHCIEYRKNYKTWWEKKINSFYYN